MRGEVDIFLFPVLHWAWPIVHSWIRYKQHADSRLFLTEEVSGSFFVQWHLIWSNEGRDAVDEACKEKKEEIVHRLKSKAKCHFWIGVHFSPLWIPKHLFSCFCQKLDISCTGFIFLRYFAQDLYCWGILLRIDIFKWKLFPFHGPPSQLNECNSELASPYNLDGICEHAAIEHKAFLSVHLQHHGAKSI